MLRFAFSYRSSLRQSAFTPKVLPRGDAREWNDNCRLALRAVRPVEFQALNRDPIEIGAAVDLHAVIAIGQLRDRQCPNLSPLLEGGDTDPQMTRRFLQSEPTTHLLGNLRALLAIDFLQTFGRRNGNRDRDAELR